MDNSQTNENELQKAIDDITKNSGPVETGNVVSELESKIQNQMGVPPVPPVPPMGGGVNLAPLGSEPVNNMPTPESPAMAEMTLPVMPTPAEGNVNAADTSKMTPENVSTDGLEEVKEAMLKDLFPLMDKIKIMPEQKFKIYKQMIEVTKDKSMIASAYAAVKEIADETMRAEALLYLLEQTEN